MDIEIFDERLCMLPQKAIYWPSQKILLLADLHLGKINHFRRSGIAVPQKANDHNLEILLEVIAISKPQRIVCLGDLFHSHYNPEWEVFGEVIKHYSNISFELVPGNHDIMSQHQYIRKGIILHDALQIGSFLFTHHPMETVPEHRYNFAGHIHPGVTLRGKGRQSVTLPCFYFGARQGLLPAFGQFTGLARIAPRKDDRIFVIAEHKIVSVS
ncbi:MAG: ligase-associated DNA damage response endonuclease PdeM [Bacteroidota bacterium]